MNRYTKNHDNTSLAENSRLNNECEIQEVV